MRLHLALITTLLISISCDITEFGGDKRCNTKIDEYLYGVEYDDYDFDGCKEYFDNKFMPSGMCSEVRRGNYIGRNLDWYINCNASAIIKMNHTDDHYASIGIVGCFPQFSYEIAESGKYDEVYKYLPFKTEDGINEKGLYVGINVMPTGETSFDTDSWRPHQYGLGAAHTNPSADVTCAVNYLPRILLDRAASVAEAKEIINSIDWTEPFDYPHKGETQSFHWLISDPENSTVLEFIDNKAHFTDATSFKEPGFGTIMTNFTNCLKEAGIMQINGIGYERWDILNDGYTNYTDFPDNPRGMQKLMSEVWFSKYYTTPSDSEKCWFSECASDETPAKYLYNNPDMLKDPKVQDGLKKEAALFNDKANWYNDETTLWFSTHTSVYDIKAKKLHVLVHEGLDGMKSFYKASLKSKFAKPLEHK